MRTRAVLITSGRADLLLRDISRHADGSIKAADVENGAWRFRRTANGECSSHYHGDRGHRPVTSWADPGYIEVDAPRGRDYNEVMAKATEAFHAR